MLLVNIGIAILLMLREAASNMAMHLTRHLSNTEPSDDLVLCLSAGR
jgi:hypothetical protein